MNRKEEPPVKFWHTGSNSAIRLPCQRRLATQISRLRAKQVREHSHEYNVRWADPACRRRREKKAMNAILVDLEHGKLHDMVCLLKFQDIVTGTLKPERPTCR